jgi:hypothetical protein
MFQSRSYFFNDLYNGVAMFSTRRCIMCVLLHSDLSTESNNLVMLQVSGPYLVQLSAVSPASAT